MGRRGERNYRKKGIMEENKGSNKRAKGRRNDETYNVNDGKERQK